jgi:hypothetical protein
MSDVKENVGKVGERNFEQIAETIYGKPTTPKEGIEEGEVGEAATPESEVEEGLAPDPLEVAAEDQETVTDPAIEESKESRDFAELADSVYPEENPRVAEVLPSGLVATTVRDLEGNILYGGKKSSYSDVRDLVAYHINALSNADLSGIDFAFREFKDARLSNADLSKCTFHGTLSWSDLTSVNFCGANLQDCDFGYSDLSNVEFDSNTDVKGANFTGAKYNFESVKLCKNWRFARGFHM